MVHSTERLLQVRSLPPNDIPNDSCSCRARQPAPIRMQSVKNWPHRHPAVYVARVPEFLWIHRAMNPFHALPLRGTSEKRGPAKLPAAAGLESFTAAARTLQAFQMQSVEHQVRALRTIQPRTVLTGPLLASPVLPLAITAFKTTPRARASPQPPCTCVTTTPVHEPQRQPPCTCLKDNPRARASGQCNLALQAATQQLHYALLS